MNIDITQNSDTVIARPDGPRLDSPNALDFKEALRKVAETTDVNMIVDMRHVEFMDSSGLGALVAVSKLMPAPHQMIFANLQPLVARVFELTHLNRVFTILPDGEIACLRPHSIL
ncbi:MAG: STAS domain-containing protein, partial [Pseudomonadota bacterium]